MNDHPPRYTFLALRGPYKVIHLAPEGFTTPCCGAPPDHLFPVAFCASCLKEFDRRRHPNLK